MTNNTTPAKKLAAPKVITSLRAGAGVKTAYCTGPYNHNQTLRVKSAVKAGGTALPEKR